MRCAMRVRRAFHAECARHRRTRNTKAAQLFYISSSLSGADVQWCLQWWCHMVYFVTSHIDTHALADLQSCQQARANESAYADYKASESTTTVRLPGRELVAQPSALCV